MIGKGALNVSPVNEFLINDGTGSPERYRRKFTAAITPAVSYLWGVFDFYSGAFRRRRYVIGQPLLPDKWKESTSAGGSWTEQTNEDILWHE